MNRVTYTLTSSSRAVLITVQYLQAQEQAIDLEG